MLQKSLDQGLPSRTRFAGRSGTCDWLYSRNKYRSDSTVSPPYQHMQLQSPDLMSVRVQQSISTDQMLLDLNRQGGLELLEQRAETFCRSRSGEFFGGLEDGDQLSCRRLLVGK